MINVNGYEFYTADDAVKILCMKYSSVIFLLRKNNIKKYKNKYIITKDEMDTLLNRKNQYIKEIHINEDNLLYNK